MKKIALCALIAVFVAGAAGATTEITSLTNFDRWLLDGSTSPTPGFILLGTAGNPTFISGQGLTLLGHDKVLFKQTANSAGKVGEGTDPFPLPSVITVDRDGTGAPQTLTTDLRSAATVAVNLADPSISDQNDAVNTPTPVKKSGRGTLLIRSVINTPIPWVSPRYPAKAGIENILSTAGLIIAAGSVKYGDSNLIPATQSVRFEGAAATLDLNGRTQSLSHIQSTQDNYGIVDFGPAGTSELRITQVSELMTPNRGDTTTVAPATGFLFSDVTFNQVTGIAQLSGTVEGALYNVGGWRGIFAGKGILSLEQAEANRGTNYTVLDGKDSVWLDSDGKETTATATDAIEVVKALAKGRALSFPIRLRDADTVLTIRPNGHVDYFQDGDLHNADAVAAVAGTALEDRRAGRQNISASDANWTATRFNGGTLALDGDGGGKVHTMGGFVRNVNVEVRSGSTLRLVATSAGTNNPSAFSDNVFDSLNLADGATLRLDDTANPRPEYLSRAGGFNSVTGTVSGISVSVDRKSVWATINQLAGNGTIDLGANTPAVDLISNPARLTTTGTNFGNGIDFDFNGEVNNRITGFGGIRISGGNTNRFTNAANDFRGPLLVVGTLEVGANHVTGERNEIYVVSGGGIKAMGGGEKTIDSGLTFGPNSYIYTDNTGGSVGYLNALRGIRLVNGIGANDKIYLTAPNVSATAGTNITILKGDGVNTLVNRIVVSDNNGLPVLDKWAVRATANNELVLNALQNVDDANNPNPTVPTSGTTAPTSGPTSGPGGTTAPTTGGSSDGSSGCDVGLGVFALALAGAVVLRKRV